MVKCLVNDGNDHDLITKDLAHWSQFLFDIRTVDQCQAYAVPRNT
jgi:hypothetical protein